MRWNDDSNSYILKTQTHTIYTHTQKVKENAGRKLSILLENFRVFIFTSMGNLYFGELVRWVCGALKKDKKENDSEGFVAKSAFCLCVSFFSFSVYHNSTERD